MHTQRTEFLSEQKKAAIRKVKILSKAEDKIYEKIENQNYDNLSPKELMQNIDNLQKNKSIVMENLVDETDTELNAHLITKFKELLKITNELMLAGVKQDHKLFTEYSIDYIEFQKQLFLENYNYHKRNNTLHKLKLSEKEIDDIVKACTDLGEEEGTKLLNYLFGGLEK